jgi:hypothetical protein
MLATVAALVIVLGLMVSLARYVRRQASDQLTKQLLAQLDTLMRQYETRYHAVPAVPAFVPGVASGGESAATQPSPLRPFTPSPLLVPTDDALPDEQTLQDSASANNRAVVKALHVEARRRPGAFANLPSSFFEEGVLHDAWGTPIVFMPALHPAVGMAMENRPFFLSAGPDRRFRTLEDNLYSYEEAEAPSATPAQGPRNEAISAGHTE